MFRTALIAIAAVSAAVTAAAAQSGAPVRKASPAQSGWEVVRVGEAKISHCLMGVRSDAAAPLPGKPQYMVAADNQFVVLRVRAAEWTFAGSRDIAVTIATADGQERQPAAIVRGQDMIDIAFGTERALMTELAASSHVDIDADGTNVRLQLEGLSSVLPVYYDCLAGIGSPTKPQVQASLAR